MAPWYLLRQLIFLSQLSGILIVSATTTVHFYTDASCKSLYATIQTDTKAGEGQCGEFATGINSASSVFVDNGCGVTTYSGPNTQSCSDDATLVPTSLCTSMSISSFSVDCMSINGTQDAYTTLLAEGTSSTTAPPPKESSTSISMADLSTEPVAAKSSSRQSVATLVPAFETHLTASPSLSATPSSATSSLLEELLSSPSSSLTPTSSASSSSSSTTSTPSPSSSPKPPTNYGNDGGLSGPSTIAIGVVLPGVAVVVAVVFGVLGVKMRRRREYEESPGVESKGKRSEREVRQRKREEELEGGMIALCDGDSRGHGEEKMEGDRIGFCGGDTRCHGEEK